ncbi:MAG: Gfo/Idh/MocA family oxidoreductase [Turicibacter sp.]|nr:Gfo/Idh/MocA family oxidoreductase [Turicibacter sp.]
MIRLGVIGTNWISKSFVEAALATGKYVFSGVYSRRQETGEAFCQGFGGGFTETDFISFCNREDIDIAYIASPNALHFEQAKSLLMAGTSVIVEKPAVSNTYEFEEIKRVSMDHGTMFFEAARHIHEANFQSLRQNLAQIGQPIGGYLNYIQYSSRYDAVLNGEEPNIFSLDYSGGTLMDLGVYPVYGAVSLFGEPQSARYFARKIRTGVDGFGTILLDFGSFDLTIMVSKTAYSKAGIEIYGTEGTLMANSIANIEHIEVESKDGLSGNLSGPMAPHGMMEEADTFADIFLDKDDASYEKLLELSETVCRVMTKLRQDGGIQFPADRYLK